MPELYITPTIKLTEVVTIYLNKLKIINKI